MRQAHTHTNSILTLFCEICNTKEAFIFLRKEGVCQICDIGKTEVKKVERRSKIGLTYSGRTMRCIVTNAKCLSRFVITTPRAPDARFAQSNKVIVRSRLYVPTLRCRCVVTTKRALLFIYIPSQRNALPVHCNIYAI